MPWLFIRFLLKSLSYLNVKLLYSVFTVVVVRGKILWIVYCCLPLALEILLWQNIFQTHFKSFCV